ncbi:MAG: PASTA domain-containing protein, partial [Oscillospiraceae bacterium]
AKAVLGNINLRIGEIEYQSSALPNGTIMSQDPKAGTTIPEGEEVKLVISGKSNSDSTMDSSAGLITLMIQLPNGIDTPTKLQAVKEGVVLSEYVINPLVESVWRPQFSGTGMAYIDILIEQGLYQKYELNFDSGTYKLIE